MDPSSSQSGSLVRRVSEMVGGRRKNTHPYKHHPSGFRSGENLSRRKREEAAKEKRLRELGQYYTNNHIQPAFQGVCPCFSQRPMPATVQHGGNHVHSHAGPCHYHPRNNQQYQQPGAISLGYGMPGVSPASVVQPQGPPGFPPSHIDPRAVVPRPGYPPGPPYNRFRGPQPRHTAEPRAHRYADDPDHDDIYLDSDNDDIFDDDDDLWPRSRGSRYRHPMPDDGLIPVRNPSDFDDSLSYRRERGSRDEPYWSRYR